MLIQVNFRPTTNKLIAGIFSIFIAMSFRVALLGIYHESNTFINTLTTLGDFENSHFLKGDSIRTEYLNAHHEIGGMLEVLDEHDIEVVPVIFAEATPGGMVSAETYQRLLATLLNELRNAGPLDGCLVVPHGAGVAEGFADMDGHWLSAVRELLGPEILIVGTLDPHANASQEMIKATNALIAYSTNPHIDQRETGKKAARLLVKSLRKEIQPTQVVVQPAVAISIEQQHTAKEPCLQLYRLAEKIGREEGILSVSVLLGFPYADVYEMGSSFIVVADNNMVKAQEAAQQLKNYLEKNKLDFVSEKPDIYSIIPALKNRPKPVLILDMGDNVGGGSPGNSAYLLNALEKFGEYQSFICIYDPVAALKASLNNISSKFHLTIGDKYEGEIELLAVVDGKFEEKNPRHGGQVNYNMGRTSIVRTAAGNIIMINSLRVPPFSLSQLTSAGIKPEDFDIIIAKGVNAPIAAYGPVCPTIIQVNTPGVTQADMTQFNFKHRRKPLFPFEQ